MERCWNGDRILGSYRHYFPRVDEEGIYHHHLSPLDLLWNADKNGDKNGGDKLSPSTREVL